MKTKIDIVVIIAVIVVVNFIVTALLFTMP